MNRVAFVLSKQNRKDCDLLLRQMQFLSFQDFFLVKKNNAGKIKKKSTRRKMLKIT